MFRFLRNKEKEVKVKKIQIGHCFNDKWTNVSVIHHRSGIRRTYAAPRFCSKGLPVQNPTSTVCTTWQKKNQLQHIFVILDANMLIIIFLGDSD